MFLLLVLFAFLATAGTMAYMVYDEIDRVEKANTFYPGVYINDFELYGATPQQAYDFLFGRISNELTNWSIELKLGEEKTWRITTEDLGIGTSLSSALGEEINKAFLIGRSGSIVERYRAILQLKTEPYKAYTADVQKNISKIDSLVSEIAEYVYRPAKDAALTFDNTRQYPVVITPEETGREIDTASLKAQIVERVNGMQAGTIDIEPKILKPNVFAASLSGELVQLADFTTPINKHSTPERNLNVERGCAAFDGKIVKSGEKVSFNGWVGERTKENGFFEALEIVSGEYDWGVGGGICQVSSTLYNAVIQAGLEVVSRTAHALPVNYVDMGADATVSDKRIDFVFRNNTGSDIYLVARVNSTNGVAKSCTFQIYGKPGENRRKYKLRHEEIEVIPIPSVTPVPDRKKEYVTYTDQQKEVSKGAKGYRVRTYLVVMDENGRVLDDKYLYEDTYKPVAPKVVVGTTPRD